MRIRKYDFNYGRRKLMENVALSAGAGVLMPWHSAMAASDDAVNKAYPDELLSVEAQTKGKIKVGDTIDASNAEYAKHLLDPGVFEQITGPEKRTIYIKAPTTDLSELIPAAYLEATIEDIKRDHHAKFDDTGNVVDQNGKRWQGGLPFKNPKTGLETWANMCLNIGRADNGCYVIEQKDYGTTGKQEYHYNFQWVELNSTARTDRKVYRGLENELRRQSVYFAASPDVRGTSFLSIWDYDMRKVPELYGYLPEFRRVRQFPANQRFEPLVPGAVWFLSDPWAAGDPYLTWGNHKIVERKPMLGPWASDFSKHDDLWDRRGRPILSSSTCPTRCVRKLSSRAANRRDTHAHPCPSAWLMWMRETAWQRATSGMTGRASCGRTLKWPMASSRVAARTASASSRRRTAIRVGRGPTFTSTTSRTVACPCATTPRGQLAWKHASMPIRIGCSIPTARHRASSPWDAPEAGLISA